MVLDLLDLPSSSFPVRTITTGATGSNVLGLGSLPVLHILIWPDLSLVPSHLFPPPAIGRDFAVRQALGDPTYSVAEDGFGGVEVKVLSDRPHASLLKAASVVGIGRSNVNPMTYCMAPVC